jgi:hypothetical protein
MLQDIISLAVVKNQLIAFMGVSEADIEIHSQRFMGYIAALHEMGMLPKLIVDK